ncbi:hypothetical protein M9H77_35133 [Catharanthus roseus]|uniref:Uncharacterized protein n=1 Tax=Catharanthus roseus TaxID=4058 RepID=A0ACB9ZNF1_CATRO|nr:hypothetical protein M9H77_35133 [Catharanthus roseus]
MVKLEERGSEEEEDEGDSEGEWGKQFKLIDVEWVVNSLASDALYLLTFTVEDSEKGVKTFEAKVLDGLNDIREVELCRINQNAIFA